MRRPFDIAMAACLAVMATVVFINVVLRYGFGSGIAASEELSRLLFVWMVFIGATAAYPAGQHMAFTSLLRRISRGASARVWTSRAIHGLVLLACVLESTSVVIGYPVALLPLPALLCALAIGAMALVDLLRGKPVSLDEHEEVIE
jgi:TRAP-type C4-dicarboxylate transport system permease small subunit